MAKETSMYQELCNVIRSMKKEDELFYFFLRACENSSFQICQICLDAGADINICSSSKETLLYKLAANGTFTTEVGDWLIEKGANINIDTGCSLSALSIACYLGNFNIAKYFIEEGIKIRQYKDYQSESDLKQAVEGKNYEIVKMLLELGVDLEYNIEYEHNPFIYAVEHNLPEILELFLQKGVSPNFYIDGSTPLHKATASYVENIQVAKILLKYNANVNARLEGSAIFINECIALTPMDIAVLKHDVDMQKLLTSFGAIVSSKEEKEQALMECSDEDKDLWF